MILCQFVTARTNYQNHNPNEQISARERADSARILDIKSWMSVNKLKLNDEKTEFLIMTSKISDA